MPRLPGEFAKRRSCEPDAAARAYLRVIAREPEVVRRALEPLPRQDQREVLTGTLLSCRNSRRLYPASCG
ncbi:MAG: hypothetical protein ACLPWS_16635 [Rhodomicrobium sp.]